MQPAPEPPPRTAAGAAPRDDMPPLVAAREAERQRMALELHDEIGQHLLLLKLELARLARAAGPDGLPATPHRLDALLPMVDAAMSAVRQVAAGLRPPPLQGQGLVPALRQLAQQWCARATLRVKVGACLPVGVHNQLDSYVSWTAYRIVQEALSNAARHAGASAVEVEVAAEAGCLVLRVRDDGLGLRREPKAGRIGLGLQGMRERAEACGGQLRVYRAAEAGGCVVEARLPLRARARGEVSTEGVVN